MPEGAEEGIRKGMYLLEDSGVKNDDDKPVVQLMGSGAILREVMVAAKILDEDYGVAADLWSVPSFNEVRKDGQAVARRNHLNPDQPARTPWITGLLKDRPGPVVAATDYVRAYADQVREYVPQQDYTVLGTDRLGRPDPSEDLGRSFAE